MDWKKNIMIFFVVFVLASLFLRPPAACVQRGGAGRGRPPGARVVDLTVASRPAQDEGLSPYSFTIHAEVASTPQERTQGLSGRRGLEPGYGMLYAYNEPQVLEFSEAATPFPLSLAFLDADGRILQIEETRANDARLIKPQQPVSYALELRSGWFEDRNIGPGDRLLIPPDLVEKPQAGGSPPTGQPVPQPPTPEVPRP